MLPVEAAWHDGMSIPMTASRDTSELAEQLGHVPLFQGLAADVLARIRGQARSRAIAAGESFFQEGDEADPFFVLTGGRVKLTQLTPEGHQVVLRIIGAGDAFGGAGAFGDLTYPIGAEAVEPAVALVWTSNGIRQLLETEPRVALNAVQFVASRLHDLQRRHRQLMTERVERRVAASVAATGTRGGPACGCRRGNRLPRVAPGHCGDDRHHVVYGEPDPECLGGSRDRTERSPADSFDETARTGVSRRRPTRTLKPPSVAARRLLVCHAPSVSANAEYAPQSINCVADTDLCSLTATPEWQEF
jgi:CRP-like cAMP-binding protein